MFLRLHARKEREIMNKITLQIDVSVRGREQGNSGHDPWPDDVPYISLCFPSFLFLHIREFQIGQISPFGCSHHGTLEFLHGNRIGNAKEKERGEAKTNSLFSFSRGGRGGFLDGRKNAAKTGWRKVRKNAFFKFKWLIFCLYGNPRACSV